MINGKATSIGCGNGETGADSVTGGGIGSCTGVDTSIGTATVTGIDVDGGGGGIGDGADVDAGDGSVRERLCTFDGSVVIGRFYKITCRFISIKEYFLINYLWFWFLLCINYC